VARRGIIADVGDAAAGHHKGERAAQQILEEGFGIFVGRSQLRPMFAEDVNLYKVKITSVHTIVRGDAGWDWVDFGVIPVDTKEKPFMLAMLFLWTKINGEWMCQGDFYNYGSFSTGKVTSQHH
jgi:hypothetical protein